MLILATTLFFANPAPLDMPRAEAFMVASSKEEMHLEDRFRADDLWLSQQTLGQWRDDEGRYFTVSRLDIVPPKATTQTLTRKEYSKGRAFIDPKKDLDPVTDSIDLLSPIEITDEPSSPGQKIRGRDPFLRRDEYICDCMRIQEGKREAQKNRHSQGYSARGKEENAPEPVVSRHVGVGRRR